MDFPSFPAPGFAETALPVWRARLEPDGSLLVAPAALVDPDPFVLSSNLSLARMILSQSAFAHWDGSLWIRAQSSPDIVRLSRLDDEKWLALDARLGGSAPNDCFLLESGSEAGYAASAARARLALGAAAERASLGEATL